MTTEHAPAHTYAHRLGEVRFYPGQKLAYVTRDADGSDHAAATMGQAFQRLRQQYGGAR